MGRSSPKDSSANLLPIRGTRYKANTLWGLPVCKHISAWECESIGDYYKHDSYIIGGTECK